MNAVSIVRRIGKTLAYALAGLVILLAIAVGLFRLFLPRLPEYQDEIKAWASDAIGTRVEFAGMDARWGLRGPELKFYEAELIRPDTEARIVAADEVGIGVSLVRLFSDRTLVVDSVSIRDTEVEVRRLDDGQWRVQGGAIDDLLDVQPAGGSNLGAVDVVGSDIRVHLIQPGDERPTTFHIDDVILQHDEARVAIDGVLQLPQELGQELAFSVTRLHAADGAPVMVNVEADDVSLSGLKGLLPEGLPGFDAGRGDFDVAVSLAEEDGFSVTANVSLLQAVTGDTAAHDISARLAANRDAQGWLLAADDLRVKTAAGSWPTTSLRLEGGTETDGRLVMLDARAQYIDLELVQLFAPWLPEKCRETLASIQPGGTLTNLTATFSGLDSDDIRYSLQADLGGLGVEPYGGWPGVRGLTAAIRADHDGGLLDLNASNLTLALPQYLSRQVQLDSAVGTIIWRRGDNQTTVLSDSISLANSFYRSQNNVQITLADETAPVVDIVSNFSIDDLVAAKAYIPEPIMSPRLFLWFQDALQSGRMPNGSARLSGPLDAFPFDNDEGRFLVEAVVADLDFRYARQFPVSQVREMDVVLDRMRLYTNTNRSVSLGNETVDAQVEIADLRQPVLTIDALTTGSLESLRNYSANSPIGRVFGGHLERITVAGDATLKLDLTVPIKSVQDYQYSAQLSTANGEIAIAGLKPPLTELSGNVTITRDSISSEALGGQFLQQPVSLQLHNAAEDASGYRVVATAAGTATAGALVDAFELPLAEQLAGQTAYQAKVHFPVAAAAEPQALRIDVESSLAGLAVSLPAPFNKNAAQERPFEAALFFEPGGEVIRSTGEVAAAAAGPDESQYAWQLAFRKTDDAWDFDRGTLTLGTATAQPAEVRGLHIFGNTPEIRLEDWLDLSRGESKEINAAERIRSIDVNVANLYVLGQHYNNHHVRVDRSARDWLVQIDGDDARGSVFVPYDFDSDRALVLEMQRLVLPGDDTAVEIPADDAVQTDPRTLPAISLQASEFAVGERYLGAIDAEFVKTSAGLTSTRFVTSDPSFDVVGDGRWVHDDNDPRLSRSYLTATLTSRDVVETMRRLNYEPGVVSNDMGVLLNIEWSGGPSRAFLSSLDGEVQVRLGSGQLDEVEPGAGRVFGLMSIVALPRRLSLDFRDVFQKGFGFDKIEGTFRLEDGQAYTCNLSLEGPAADIGIIGRADLVDQRYEQTAVVSAKVGNTLPVIGGIAAGPQAAAALFLFSQIFKKPLQNMGQVYYGVSGSWDEAIVESTNEAAFTASGELAGCLADS